MRFLTSSRRFAVICSAEVVLPFGSAGALADYYAELASTAQWFERAREWIPHRSRARVLLAEAHARSNRARHQQSSRGASCSL